MEKLIEMMDNGFLIYQSKNHYVLAKISTPKNNEVLENLTFDNFDEAMAKTEEFLVQKWQPLVYYKQRGLSLRTVELNIIRASDHHSAMENAKFQAGIHLKDLDLESLEVEVRPV